MKKEIEKLLQDKPEFVDSIEICSEVLNEIASDIKKKFIEKLQERLPVNSYIYPNNNELPINIHWEKDSGTIYIGYRLHKNENKDNEYDNKSSMASEYAKILRDNHGDMKATANHFGWYTPKPYENNEKAGLFDKKKMLLMSKDESFLEDTINKIVLKEMEIRTEFEKRIKKVK